MNAEPTNVPGENKLQHRDYARRFFSNVSFGLLNQTVRLVINLFLVGYVIRRLGTEQWGLVVLATSVVAMLSLIQLGASAGIGKKLNMFFARGQSEAFRQYFTAGVVLCSVMAVVMSLGVVLLLTFAWSALNIKGVSVLEGQLVIGAVGLSAILNSFMLPLTACMQAMHRVDVHSKLSMVSLVLRTAAVVIFFELFAPKASTYTFILATTVALILGGGILWVRRNVPDARIALRLLTRTVMWDLVSFNLLTLFNSLNHVLFLQSPAIILQRHGGGLALAGLYGIVLQLNNIVRAFLLTGLNAISPVAISLESTGDVTRFKTLYLISTKTYIGVAIFLWFGFFFLGAPFLNLWLSRDVGELILALPWLIGMTAIGIAAMPSAVFTVAMERLRIPSFGGLILAVGMVATMSWAISVYQTDLLVRCSVILFIFFSAYQLLRIFVVSCGLRLRMRELLVDIVVRPALPAAMGALPLWVATEFVGVTTVLHLIVTGAVAMGVFAAFSLAFLYSHQERLTIKHVVASMRAKNH
ncbi:MAG: hypothetical protein KAV00_06575 [Phycisphaerae bacterium]|nr:hypothetical protein [Phycisphaerae bacterium]